jgi:hypothetical protein
LTYTGRVRRALVLLIVGCGGSDAPTPDAACQPATLFLNRNGGDYDTGPFDDALANHSVLLDGPRHLDPYPHDDLTWASTVACIRGGLGPFPIEIVETDPSPSPHVEIVFTTTYWAGSPGTTQIIPDSCRLGHQLEFVFGDALPTDARACQMALVGYAQMTANLSIGDNCLDFLDLSADCAPNRSFVDEEVACVDALDQPTTCRCGGTTQNTFRGMTAAFPGCSR